MSLAPGTRLGPYEILAPLGAGGMGEVYRARDTQLKRDIALKVLLDAVANEPDRVARFTREALVLASLNHPHVAHLYGFEAGPPTSFLVMELVEGPTLADLIDAAPGGLPLDHVLSIARQIADALEAAHEQGVVHRDLKPANVKVRDDGVVKVLDFGLAKALDPMASLSAEAMNSPTMTARATQMGMILGTAAYMAPEQARGKTVDKRADIWAFGAVLFEMLTGRRAFDGDDLSMTLAFVMTKEPEWARLPAATPASVRTVLQRCLQKDPKQRLRDIGDVRFALEEETGTPAQGAPLVASPGLMTRASPWVAAVMSLVSIALLGVLISRSREAGDLPTGGVQTPIRLSLAPPAGTTFARRTVPQLSPDGQQVAIVALDSSGESALWVRALDSEDAKRLDGTENANLPFWSPDGRFLAFFAAGKLKRVDVAGGLPQTLADVASPTGGSWSRDDTILFGAFPLPILRLPSTRGTATPATTMDRSRREISNFWPQFLPDGRHFLFWADGNDQGIQFGSLDDPQHRLVAPTAVGGAYSVGYLFLVREGTLVARRFDVATGQVGADAPAVASRVAVDAQGRRGLFSVSDNGRLVYADEAWVQSRLVRVDRHGRELSAVGSVRGSSLFALSRDGQRIAEDRPDPQTVTRNLWTVTVPGGQSTRVSSSDYASETFPVWSPDGARLIYMWFKDGPADLYERPSNGTGQPRLVCQSDESKFPTDWSPDGRYVVFHTTRPDAARGTNFDLWLLPLSNQPAKPVPFHQTRFNESFGRFFPDSRWLAYRSDESGRDEVYVAAVKDGERVQISTNGGSLPEWRDDGQELFYVAPDGIVMSVEMPSADPLKNGTPKPLFKALFELRGRPNYGSRYAALPGGQQFLMLVPVEDPAPFTVLLNWPAAQKK